MRQNFKPFAVREPETGIEGIGRQPENKKTKKRIERKMKDVNVTETLSARLGWETKEVEKALDAFGVIVGEKLANNDVLSMHGLGQFEARKKAERESVNPTNGKRYLIPPKLIPVFKPVASFKTYLKMLDNNG
ncbi:MAG: HU family DNA-binding protein [Tannerella sp.]|nr:HU family DNA-binding protein [Tannerella sp.]